MGFTKHIYLHCNGKNCPLGGSEAYGADGCYETIKEYKQAAIKEGWTFANNNKAFCPDCSKKPKRTANPINEIKSGEACRREL